MSSASSRKVNPSISVSSNTSRWGGGQFAESLFDLLPDQCPQVFHFGRTLLVGQQGRDFADESAFVVLPAHLRHPFFTALAAVVDDAVAGRAEEPGRDLRHRIQRIGLYEAHEHVLQNIFGLFARGDAPAMKAPS